MINKIIRVCLIIMPTFTLKMAGKGLRKGASLAGKVLAIHRWMK